MYNFSKLIILPSVVGILSVVYQIVFYNQQRDPKRWYGFQLGIINVIFTALETVYTYTKYTLLVIFAEANVNAEQITHVTESTGAIQFAVILNLIAVIALVRMVNDIVFSYRKSGSGTDNV